MVIGAKSIINAAAICVIIFIGVLRGAEKEDRMTLDILRSSEKQSFFNANYLGCLPAELMEELERFYTYFDEQGNPFSTSLSQHFFTAQKQLWKKIIYFNQCGRKKVSYEEAQAGWPDDKEYEHKGAEIVKKDGTELILMHSNLENVTTVLEWFDIVNNKTRRLLNLNYRPGYLISDKNNTYLATCWLGLEPTTDSPVPTFKHFLVTHFYDYQTGTLKREIRTPLKTTDELDPALTNCFFNSQGSHFGVTYRDVDRNNLMICDIANPPYKEYRALDIGRVMALHPDGDKVVLGHYDWNDASTNIVIFDCNINKFFITKLSFKGDNITGFELDPQGKRVAVATNKNDLILYDLQQNRHIITVKTGHDSHYPDAVAALAFDGTGTLLAVADKLGWISLWDAPSGNKIRETCDEKHRRYTQLAFSDDGTQLMQQSYTRYLYLGAESRFRTTITTIADRETKKCFEPDSKPQKLAMSIISKALGALFEAYYKRVKVKPNLAAFITSLKEYDALPASFKEFCQGFLNNDKGFEDRIRVPMFYHEKLEKGEHYFEPLPLCLEDPS